MGCSPKYWQGRSVRGIGAGACIATSLMYRWCSLLLSSSSSPSSHLLHPPPAFLYTRPSSLPLLRLLAHCAA
eukprot:1447968-Pyramimonas_sp.AAC.1